MQTWEFKYDADHAVYKKEVIDAKQGAVPLITNNRKLKKIIYRI